MDYVTKSQKKMKGKTIIEYIEKSIKGDRVMKKKVLIVGGVAGGASTAARLRRLDEDAEIIMFEKGEYISFANCGLPYYIGDVIPTREALIVQTVEQMSRKFNLDIRNLSEVISINKEEKR